MRLLCQQDRLELIILQDDDLMDYQLVGKYRFLNQVNHQIIV